MTLRAIDLCCGAGGWACAARGLPIKIVAALDWDPVALMTYELNHGTPVVRCDVRHPPLDLAGLRGKIDLVLGGIPCEPISTWMRLGGRHKRVNLDDWHGTLDACLEIVRILQPRWWCLEDVATVLGHLPPLTPYQVIDSAGYSAERRKRAYIGCFPPPREGRSCARLRNCLRPGPYRLGLRTRGTTPVRNKAWGPDTCYEAHVDRKGPTVCNLSSRRDRECVVVERDGTMRQMEWQEGAALQGFPDDYVFIGGLTQIGKHIGQSIQIDTGRAILQAIVAEAKRSEGEASKADMEEVACR